MQINNYSLEVKGKRLIENCDLQFYQGKFNHIVGKNGVGKSQVAKDFILNNSGKIDQSIYSNATLISSSSNVPVDITKKYLLKVLKSKFKSESKLNDLAGMLQISSIPDNVLIKNLSDGQKQKLKLLSFFLQDKSIIILDEITNALDKKTINDIYDFLNRYLEQHPDKTIINITHNLSDLSNLVGKYFIFKDLYIEEYDSKEQVINDYINL
ncbi:ATP-binding cassette domain-containing protein [Mammaliicoccus sp. Dog046]|uniref:ATP-binding cassette domain-containing protein n=1 Tax=Mammaliicoccus sp. Dog046 TaxID=3034233 RepID=UPI002B2579EE|nr:ATP-binding cassette domain-containing protein [Mammaliicoccus sp. Dog046]WQK86742.1 ATP-binding cassette domain-containing protein [Mammaliicoccus sp. Dog046]